MELSQPVQPDTTLTQPEKNKTRVRTRSEEKRQQIVDAASQLFVNHGYQSVSMDAVATSAGVSKQTVYSHFGCKEDLFIYAVEQRLSTAMLDQSLFQSGKSVRDILTTLGIQLLELLLSEEAVRVKRLCVSGAEQHPEVSAMFHEAGAANIHHQLTDYLTKLAEQNVLDIENPAFAAEQFLFMTEGDSVLRANLGLPPLKDPQERVEYIKSCVNTFLKAYGCN